MKIYFNYPSSPVNPSTWILMPLSTYFPINLKWHPNTNKWLLHRLNTIHLSHECMHEPVCAVGSSQQLHQGSQACRWSRSLLLCWILMTAQFAYPASFSPFVRPTPSWSRISHAAATFGLPLVLWGNGCDEYLTHTHTHFRRVSGLFPCILASNDG